MDGEVVPEAFYVETDWSFSRKPGEPFKTGTTAHKHDYDEVLAMSGTDLNDPYELNGEVEDMIYDKGNLAAGVVISKVGDFGKSEVHEKPQYTLVWKSSNGLVEETVIAIRNRYSRFSKLGAVERVFNALNS